MIFKIILAIFIFYWFDKISKHIRENKRYNPDNNLDPELHRKLYGP
jgi:hypothetical protein